MMDKQIIDSYRVSGNQITEMKLNRLSLSENETLSMLNRYKLCKDDAQSLLEELPQNTEKEYHENETISNSVFYRKLLKYSSWELLVQLFTQILCFSKNKKLIQKIITIIAVSYSVIICLSFDNPRVSLILTTEIIFIATLVLIDFLAPFIMEQVKTNIETHHKKKSGFLKLVIYVISTFLILTIYKGFNFIKVPNALNIMTKKIGIVKAAELYGDKSDVIINNDEQITKIDKEDVVLKLSYEDNFIDNVEETYKSIEYEYFYGLSYKNEDVVARDISGKEYTISQLSNQKLLIPYIDGEKTVLFYGQYNNDYWDGECIFNIYEYNEEIGKNILKIILEAEYNNGSIVSYKKITKTTTGQGTDVWSVSDRIRENDHNCGNTYYYFQINDYLLDFDLDTAKVENIIYVDNFENILKETSKLEGYYSGNTSDGYYNDDTGNAYMVKYAEDGTIRTLYKGEFKNGLFDDQTGNAWEIVFDSSYNINRYFYYKGKFINGNRMGRVTPDNYIQKEDIHQIIDDMTFDCMLNWY